MLDHVFENRDTGQGVRSGVIGSHIDSFAAHLATCGYAATTVRSQLRLLEDFSQWLTRRRCGMCELNDELVDTFVTYCQRRGRLHRVTASGRAPAKHPPMRSACGAALFRLLEPGPISRLQHDKRPEHDERHQPVG